MGQALLSLTQPRWSIRVQDEFDWDPVKATTNVHKHGISFEEAMTVFADRLALTIYDEAAASLEERWITLGMNRRRRLVLVVHTHMQLSAMRAEIRIISARKPTKAEVQDYESGNNGR